MSRQFTANEQPRIPATASSRLLLPAALLAVLLAAARLPAPAQTASTAAQEKTIIVGGAVLVPRWQGWGSSLAWWARAIGGTRNAGEYADLIYTMKQVHGYPGLGLNIVRYNAGGGGSGQPEENKGPKLQWQMDIHGFWVHPGGGNAASDWNWSVDSNQRAIVEMARQRGANVFQLFSNAPLWWMTANRSTSGSNTGGNCLLPADSGLFATYLATVARHSADRWGIRFSSVEPFNEPSADWWKYPGRQEGCHFSPAAQAVVLRKLRAALDAQGLQKVAVAASDENDMDVALNTWNQLPASAKAVIGQVGVHGYYRGVQPYRGPSGPALRRAVGGRPLWMSEYGEGDASGYTMAQSIVFDIRQLRPRAWVYWQPVEPRGGWGPINARFVDTHDHSDPKAITALTGVNRKFYVFGQFTRHIRPGFSLVAIGGRHSIAAFSERRHELVIVTVSGSQPERVRYSFPGYRVNASAVRQIVTTTHPAPGIPDWKQHASTLRFDRKSQTLRGTLYPQSVYTFVLQDVRRN